MLTHKKVVSPLFHLLEHHFCRVLASNEDLNVKTIRQLPFVMYVSTVQHDGYSYTQMGLCLVDCGPRPLFAEKKHFWCW